MNQGIHCQKRLAMSGAYVIDYVNNCFDEKMINASFFVLR